MHSQSLRLYDPERSCRFRQRALWLVTWVVAFILTSLPRHHTSQVGYPLFRPPPTPPLCQLEEINFAKMGGGSLWILRDSKTMELYISWNETGWIDARNLEGKVTGTHVSLAAEGWIRREEINKMHIGERAISRGRMSLVTFSYRFQYR